MIYLDTVLKILNCRNGGKTKKCFNQDIGQRTRALFYVYGMKFSLSTAWNHRGVWRYSSTLS